MLVKNEKKHSELTVYMTTKVSQTSCLSPGWLSNPHSKSSCGCYSSQLSKRKSRWRKENSNLQDWKADFGAQVEEVLTRLSWRLFSCLFSRTGDSASIPAGCVRASWARHRDLPGLQAARKIQEPSSGQSCLSSCSVALPPPCRTWMERGAIFTRFDIIDGWSPWQESNGCYFLGTTPWLSNCLVLLSDNSNRFTNQACWKVLL